MLMLELFTYFYSISLFQIPYMTLAWIMCVFFKNGSYVDFAWPSGFMVMTFQIFYNSEGYLYRKLLISIPYIICGLRFNLGWIFARKHYKHEDRRWNMWREMWSKGEGFLKIKNINLNFFIFYHCQSLTNIFVMSIPLLLTLNNKSENLNIVEILGLVLWIISFCLENLADSQLARFKKKKENREKVMKYGLWKYSRHPNYFFEWTIWISYLVMALPSAESPLEYILLSFIPIIAYYFLVCFTGVPMCEKAALDKRGEQYKIYQNDTNMFFIWFK